MKGVTIRRPATDVLAWQSLISCGFSVLVGPDHVLSCEDDESQKSFSLFCENLDHFLHMIQQSGRLNVELPPTLKLRPNPDDMYVSSLEHSQQDEKLGDAAIDETLYNALKRHRPDLFPLSWKLFANATAAWTKFLRKEEIVQRVQELQALDAQGESLRLERDPSTSQPEFDPLTPSSSLLEFNDHTPSNSLQEITLLTPSNSLEEVNAVIPSNSLQEVNAVTPSRTQTKTSPLTTQFLTTIAETWVKQFTHVCHIKKRTAYAIKGQGSLQSCASLDSGLPNYVIREDKVFPREGAYSEDAVFSEFQRMFLLDLPSSHELFPQMLDPSPEVEAYRRHLENFMHQHRSGMLNGIDFYYATDNLLNKKCSSVESLRDFLAFCGDALENARFVFLKCAQFEPVIMRLAFMQATGILSFIQRSEGNPMTRCSDHPLGEATQTEMTVNEDEIIYANVLTDDHERIPMNNMIREDFGLAIKELQEIKRLSNFLSQARSNYSSLSTKFRKKRFESVQEFAQLMRSIDPLKQCLACNKENLLKCRVELEALMGQLGDLKKEAETKWRATMKKLLKSENKVANETGEEITPSEKLAEKLDASAKAAFRKGLVQILPTRSRFAELFKKCEASEHPPMHSGVAPLLDPAMSSEVQRWLLTRARVDELYRVLVLLNPLLESVSLPIDFNSVKELFTFRIMDNGFSRFELVTAILVLCNAMTTASGADDSKDSPIYKNLSKLVGILNSLQGRFSKRPHPFMCARNRFALRAMANEGDSSKLMKLFDFLKEAALGDKIVREVELLALDSDFEEAKYKTIKYLYGLGHYFKDNRGDILKFKD
eukprot:Gregarina_sp_Poly_1__2097@NODE_1553_length_3857_cov_16_446174_g1025_i0_p1_GENE_NODE_1553_length_3857_cov_16_446174_g1025_i0NODE_1553_length_3857_cov_16_446174_g1025_i0_p1_ORF_typecomplete_len827_score96_49DUF4573/PF15140_6/0_0019CCCAP/PF15964_5/0_01SHE3/PF17078_5/0_052HOOK/PF05622_12/1_3e03HOOK/PF05622_12/0_012Syntaxin18_N/PF10496_9/0_78_NODE_1553_length_3857_cov_16_446174_g1025_i010943574